MTSWGPRLATLATIVAACGRVAGDPTSGIHGSGGGGASTGGAPGGSGGASTGGAPGGSGGASTGGSAAQHGTTDAGTIAPSDASASAAPCSLTFDVTTVTANGTYAPRNVGAVWIEDASGHFVKTLDLWGLHFLTRATAWWRSSDGNTVDVVTSATRPGHGPVQTAWDCTDTAGGAVPYGRYQVCMTFAEDNRELFSDAGHTAYLCVPFDRTPRPLSVSFPDDPHFRDMQLSMRR
jgi:hypothetical protein